jgi:hypothetical protein
MRRAIAFLFLVVACGCGSDSTSPTDTFRGDFVLQTVNGKPLPYTWTYTGGAFYTLKSYSITVIPGGSWLSAVSYSYSDQGQIVNRPNGGEAGTFTYIPGSGFVSFISIDKTTNFTGTRSGSTLTMSPASTDIYVFTQAP